MGFEYKIFDGCKKLIDTLVQEFGSVMVERTSRRT